MRKYEKVALFLIILLQAFKQRKIKVTNKFAKIASKGILPYKANLPVEGVSIEEVKLLIRSIMSEIPSKDRNAQAWLKVCWQTFVSFLSGKVTRRHFLHQQYTLTLIACRKTLIISARRKMYGCWPGTSQVWRNAGTGKRLMAVQISRRCNSDFRTLLPALELVSFPSFSLLPTPNRPCQSESSLKARNEADSFEQAEWSGRLTPGQSGWLGAATVDLIPALALSLFL